MARKRAPRASGPPPPQAGRRGGRAWLIVAFLAYAAITLYVGLHHEPWRDEADPWLLMRDGGVRFMLSRIGYMGMPPLWYLLIAPLPKLGLPYISMTLLHLAIAWTAAFVFLWFAPLPKLVRVLFVFSYFMAYEYAVVARPYAPAILFFFAALACWQHREERPVPMAIFVALMALTTTHTLFFAAVLGAIYLYETVRARALRDVQRWIAIAIMLGAGLFSAFLLRPPSDVPSHVFRGVAVNNLVWTFSNAFFPDFPLYVGVVLSLGVLAVTALAVGRRVMPQVFLWSAMLFLALLYTFVWAAGLRHAGLFTVTVAGALWLATAYPAPPETARWRKVAHVVLGLSFAYATVVAVAYWRRDVESPFSDAAEMAAFIKKHELQKFPIAAHLPTASEALLPYLGGRFYYPGNFEYGSYMLWDAAYNVANHTSYGVAVAQAEQQFQGEPWLLLVNQPMKRAEEAGFRLVYATRGIPFEHLDERYWLYAPADWSGPPLPESE